MEMGKQIDTWKNNSMFLSSLYRGIGFHLLV